MDGVGAGGVALLRRLAGVRSMVVELRQQDDERRADREDERGGDRQPDVLLARGRDRDRQIVHAAFLAQPSGDLQPDVIGRLRIAERLGGIADPPQVALERPAGVAVVEMLSSSAARIGPSVPSRSA